MGNGRPLVVYPMLKGEPFNRGVSERFLAEARQRVAKQLAEFLRVLHSFPVDEAASYGIRERPMAETNREFREGAQEVVYPKLTEQEKDVFDGWFETYDSDPAYSAYTPALVHGDLQDRHVLFDPECEEISGIIDFSDIWISDPDHDLHYLQREHGGDFFHELLRWYEHDNPERLAWKSRFFELLRYLDEIIWGTEDVHLEHVEEGWRDLRKFLADTGNS